MPQENNIANLSNKLCVVLASVYKVKRDIPEVCTHKMAEKITIYLKKSIDILNKMKEVEKVRKTL